MGKKIIYDESQRKTVGRALAQSLRVFGLDYTLEGNIDAIEKNLAEDTDSVIFLTESPDTSIKGSSLRKRNPDTNFLFVSLPTDNEDWNERTAREIKGEVVDKPNLIEIVKKVSSHKKINPTLVKDYGFAFEADPKGLTEVLMDQFSEPLLCFRELVQNSVDANSDKIEINTSYDKEKNILAVSVKDNGDGMDLRNILTYLTLFDSTKDTDIKKIGQMGAGKVFAHALKPKKMIVETGDGKESHRIIFNPDLSGKILKSDYGKGTEVVLALPMKRGKARAFNKKLTEVVRDWCQYVKTPLFINGEKINRPFDLDGLYVEKIREEGLEAVVKFGSERGFEVLKGGILLERQVYLGSTQYEKGNLSRLFGGLVDAQTLEFPISRNGVVRNNEFDIVFGKIKGEIVRRYTKRFLEDIAKDADVVEDKRIREFFTNVLANRGYGFLGKEECEKIRKVRILENVDGSRLSVDEVREKIKDTETLYYTSGLSNTELSAFLDKGIPVLRTTDNLVLYGLFEDVKKVSLDNKYFRGKSFRSIGSFNFDEISGLLNRYFVSKIYNGSGPSGSGFLGLHINREGSYDNPFNFGNLQIYGAHFSDLKENPEENVLLDSFNETGYYSTRRAVIFNVNHPFMKKMENLMKTNPKLAQFFIACELIKSKKVFPNVSYRMREHEMSRIGLKAVDNETD